MKILVTGGAGFIGSHTCDALVDAGHDVRILDCLKKPVHLKGKPDWINPKAEFILGDVTDRGQLTAALKDVEAVYHLAAYQDYLPDLSTFFHTNALSTALIYELAVEHNLPIQRVVVASSQFVQGEGAYRCDRCELSYSPLMRDENNLKAAQWEHYCRECNEALQWQWTKESHVSPPNAYALSKHSQEQQAITFGTRYEIPSVALRYSIVQGPRQSFYNAYSGACRIFSLSYYFDKAPTLYEDGLQCRDFVSVKDVVKANLMALNNDDMIGQGYNVGGGKPYTVKEFSDIVKAEIESRKDRELPIASIPGKYRFGDTRNACSDTSALEALGWKAEYGPEDSVKEYVDWLYEQDNVDDILAYAEKTMKSMNVVRDTSTVSS